MPVIATIIVDLSILGAITGIFYLVIIVFV